MVETSALIFTVLTGIVILFQLGLAIGMPWGSASMGGKFPGKYPHRMRIVAIINIVVLCLIGLIVLTRAQLLLPQFMPYSKIGIWIVVVFYSIGTILNAITPSKIERIWVPVAAVQLVTSIIVAIG